MISDGIVRLTIRWVHFFYLIETSAELNLWFSSKFLHQTAGSVRLLLPISMIVSVKREFLLSFLFYPVLLYLWQYLLVRALFQRLNLKLVVDHRGGLWLVNTCPT